MTTTESNSPQRIVPSTFTAPAASAAAAHPHAAHAPSSDGQPAARPAYTHGGGTPRGVQSVKFSFFRVSDRTRRASKTARADLGKRLTRLLEESSKNMLTRVYSTIGTRGDTDFLVWQAHDELRPITDWHAELLRSPLGGALERPHSFLSMTMRSLYTNDLHEGLEKRTRIRTDGGVNQYLFVYPMAKTRPWYELPAEDRQRMMNEHIEIGHKYHGIKINTTYSYGLDDQEFVVAFEGDDPGEFLALVRELRDSEASSYTLFDTPMFTCRMLDISELSEHIGLTGR
ncbi:MAG: chlorite dismutase family protein [Chloroflexota bacterium]